MSNDKKSLIYMMSKQMYVEHIDKILEITGKIAQKFQIDPNELMLVFCLDLLHTTLVVSKENGFRVDLHAYADAIDAELGEIEK